MFHLLPAPLMLLARLAVIVSSPTDPLHRFLLLNAYDAGVTLD